MIPAVTDRYGGHPARLKELPLELVIGVFSVEKKTRVMGLPGG